MAQIDISGITIDYDLVGDSGAPAIALTPGGRFPKEAPGIRDFAQELAAGGMRVLIWDRPNSGQSDLYLEGASESAMQGRFLIELIRALDLGPTALAGGSAGSRTALFAALHDPSAVSHLIQWWISGGPLSLLSLGAAYACEPAITASMGGMAAVAQLPTWAGYLQGNARAHAALLAQDPQDFIATMTRWADAFVPSPASPVPGMSEADLSTLDIPTLVFRGSERDLYHPAWMCERLAKLLPDATMVDSPWTEEEFVQRQIDAGKTGSGHFLDWPRLAPAILAFIARADAPAG